MKKIIIFLILFFSFNINVNAYGNDNYDESIEDTLDEQLKMFDFEGMKTIISNTGYEEDFDFEEIIKGIILGENDFSFKEIINKCFRKLFSEVFANLYLIKNLIIVCILSALLKNLTEAFKQKETGELGFYVSYIVVVMILFSSFSTGLSILQNTSEDLITIMQGALPLIISLLVATGNTANAYLFQPVMLFVIQILSFVTSNVFIPLISISAVLQIINYLTQREILTKFSNLIKSCVSWGLKGSAILFMSVLSIQRLSAPILNGTINKTAKVAINMIPVVGDVLTGAVDGIAYWTYAIKNGVSLTIIILIIFMCMIPVIKLISLVFIYKFTAAIIQPICDKRIIECIDTIGGYTAIILGVLFTIIVMFIFSAIIVLSAASI